MDTKIHHLTLDQRLAIEDGILRGASAASIARSIGVSTSSVLREVKRNRTCYIPTTKNRKRKLLTCAHYRDCTATNTACKKCTNPLYPCKQCLRKLCIETCPDFRRACCPLFELWPHVCPKHCQRMSSCMYERAHYRALDAQQLYEQRLVATRQGAHLSDESLQNIEAFMRPYIKQGQSPEAIFLKHQAEIPISISTFYRYQSRGYFSFSARDYLRKGQLKKYSTTKVKRLKKDTIDRAGHTFSDFLDLSYKDRQRVVQLDSMCGYRRNTHDILSLHIKATKFQFYFLKEHASTKAVPAILDYLEKTLGSIELFEKLFGILLADRGIEFNNIEAIERSCLEPDKKRAKLYFCVYIPV